MASTPGPPSPKTPKRPLSTMMRTPNHATPRSNSRLSISNTNTSTNRNGQGTRTSDDEQKTSVKVVVRVRPPLKSIDEKNQHRLQRSIVHVASSTTMTIDSDKARTKLFIFDQIFDQDVNQEGVWDYLMESINSFVQGYNCSLIAYGQSGSGKSYTMGTTGSLDQSDSETMGVIPRAAIALFNTLDGPKFSSPAPDRHSITALRAPTKYTASGTTEKSWTLKATYVEIYNETLKDLLVPDSVPVNERDQVVIREDREGHIIMTGLRQREVNSVDDLMAVLNFGSEIRQTGSTLQNDASSRSHAVFSLSLIQRKQNGGAIDKRASIPNPLELTNSTDSWTMTDSKLHFVDLAGSERLKTTGAQGDRAKEGISINAGLASLGKVISQLSSKHSGHVSYRDSKLTRLLQDSLGGNAVTYMIACVAPAEAYLSETLNTVSYAQRARAIQSKPKIQQIADDTDRVLIDRLKAEVVFLRAQLRSTERGRDLGEQTGNDGSEQRNATGVELINELLENRLDCSQLSQRHADLIARMTRARNQELKDSEIHEDTVGAKAEERLQRSTSFADAVEQVILEYEKTIQALEASLSNTRSLLSETQTTLQESEGKSVHAEILNQQLQARLQKMIDREANTEHYLHDLEDKLDAHTSGEGKSSAIITELRKEITRLRENEATCEDYISTLEERLADADQDNEMMHREIERLEHVIERQRSLGKLDHLLLELDQIQQDTKVVDGGPVTAVSAIDNTNNKDALAHSRKQSLTSRRGRDINCPEGNGEDGAVQRSGKYPATSVIDGPMEDGLDIEIESPVIDVAIARLSTHDNPSYTSAQSKAMDDKLETVTQELLDLRVEHGTTVHDYNTLAIRYENALRTLAELQDVVDESRNTGSRGSIASNSTNPTSFLADARVNELKSYGGQYSPSQSLSSELSSAGESTSTHETSDVDIVPQTFAVRDEVLIIEAKKLRKLVIDQDAAYKALTSKYEELEKQHKQSLEHVIKLRAETARPSSRNSAMLDAPPRTASPVIRRKSSHNLLMVDKAHRSFAALRNIAAENFESQTDIMQCFEFNLNSAMHELYLRSERVQELEADITSIRKEMEKKMIIISGLTRERSSIRNSSTMDVSIVASMKDQLLNSEKQIKDLQYNSKLRENELHLEIDSLQATIASYAHQAATAKVKEQRLTMTSVMSQDAQLTDLRSELSVQAAEHQKILERMRTSERQLLSTIAEMATRVVAPPPNSSVKTRDETEQTMDTELSSRQQEMILSFQRELDTHRFAIVKDDNQLSQLEAAHQNTKSQLDKLLVTQETLNSVLDEYKAQSQLHADVVNRLEGQILMQQGSIQKYEDAMITVQEHHDSHIKLIQSELSKQHASTINELTAQHEIDASADREELTKMRAMLDMIGKELHSATGFAVETDMLESTIAELAADQRAFVSLQGKHDQMKGQVRDLNNIHKEVLTELETTKKQLASLRIELSAGADLKADYASTTDQLRDLKKELQELENKNKKNSRLVEELEEQLSSNFDQHQLANNRLSTLQNERNALLEEANASQSVILTELEAVKEAYAHLQSELQRVSPYDDQGNKRSLSVTHTPVLHKNASVTSLYSQPPNVPLPALPSSKAITHTTKTSINSIIKSPLSPSFPAGARSPSPPQRPNSPDLRLAEVRLKCEDQEARIRTIEKHLSAEKQLTATLEEALTDLERQSNKVKSDCDAWRQRATDLENDLKAAKQREKERRESGGKEKYSINTVEEEKRRRKDAEAARAHLEEKMNALNKKKKKKGLNCF